MRLLVTLGTDGNTDWVRTPDGQKFNLGSVSALSFVTKLALKGGDARKALDGFLRGEEVLLRVDDDKMWDLLAPRRSRWAADSFIPSDHRKRGTGTMTISKDLEVLENHIRGLQAAAKAKASPKKMREGASILGRLVNRVASQSDDSVYFGLAAADQSNNSNLMNLGEPDVHDAADPKPDVVTVEEVDQVKAAGSTKLAYDTYRANSDAATRILDQMEAVDTRINDLITAGKRFNSKRARADIHAVTAKVASIVNDVDLTTPWVAGDLAKLAARAEQLHKLFFPAK